MKALVYTGPDTAEVKDVAEPVAKEGQVKLRVKYCGVCGTDISIYHGTHARAKAPLVMGHEFIGEVMHDGKRFKKGDRVAAYPLLSCGKCLPCRTGNAHVCNTLGLLGIDVDGGASEYVCVDEDVLVKVPDGVSDKAAGVIEPLAVTLRAIHQSRLKSLDVALVTGAGPIGLLTGLLLKRLGASKVLISDVNENRLKLAAAMGMTPVAAGGEANAAREATNGEGVDVMYECSGAESIVLQMTDFVRVGGTICIIAQYKSNPRVNLLDFHFKEHIMVSTRVYAMEEFRQAAEYTAAISDELEMVVSHIVPLKDSSGIFSMIANPDNGAIKVLIDCG